MYKPEHLTKWRKESDYGGEDFSEWYILIAKTRDSELLDESNFDCILRDHPENKAARDENKGILYVRFGHWTCGWIDALMIHESDDDLLMIGDEIKAQLDDYPVYDENDWGMRECDAQYDLVNQEITWWLKNNADEWSEELAEKLSYEYCQNANDNSSYPNDDEIAELFAALNQ